MFLPFLYSSAHLGKVAVIPTKERSALDYLLRPVVASFDQAFRQK